MRSNPPLAVDDRRIVRSADPPNLEMPFKSLDGFFTPTELFYVRSHFPTPAIALSHWRLTIEGEVEKPFTIDYEELVRLESRTLSVTLECAGNNRAFLDPKVEGVPWELGAVGNAEWTGVPLSILLERAEIKRTALEVILEGADQGRVTEAKGPPGVIRFARSLPLAKAQEDVLLVHTMNGRRLLAEHGFPIRAIVPGWFAVASVKWLERIVVTDRPFMGYYQTLDYAYWQRRGEIDELVPLTLMQLKAEIASPAPDEIVPVNAIFPMRGAAWTGQGEVAKVEISADAGVTWNLARLLDDPSPHAWRRWEFQWKTPVHPGKCTLLARATDSSGRTQPGLHDPNYGTYMIHHLLPITVEAR